MQFSKVAAAVALTTFGGIAAASSHGAIGQVYPVAEESALTMIMNKLREKERTGELKKLEQEAVRRSVNSITKMPPVAGIGTVQARTQRVIDPTVYYPKAVTTDEGQVVVPAGARINPLEITSLSKTLVFFDGRDPAQREAVRKLVLQHRQKVKPILVAGAWLDMTRSWKTQVFYDQNGSLSKRFGITAVPSLIRQQGKTLLLEEVPAKDLR